MPDGLPPGVTPEMVDQALADNSNALDQLIARILQAAQDGIQGLQQANGSVVTTLRRFFNKQIKRQQAVLDAVTGNIGGVVGGQIESNAQTLDKIKAILADSAMGGNTFVPAPTGVNPTDVLFSAPAGPDMYTTDRPIAPGAPGDTLAGGAAPEFTPKYRVWLSCPLGAAPSVYRIIDSVDITNQQQARDQHYEYVDILFNTYGKALEFASTFLVNPALVNDWCNGKIKFDANCFPIPCPVLPPGEVAPPIPPGEPIPPEPGAPPIPPQPPLPPGEQPPAEEIPPEGGEVAPPLPPIPPVAPLGEEFPVLECPFIDKNGKLPAVGSQEWCACMEAVVQWLDQIGRWAIRRIAPQTIYTVKDTIDIISKVSQLPVVSTILPDSTIAGIADKQKGILGATWDQVITAVGTFSVSTGLELLGLTLCRTFIRLLKHIRVGWDLAIWSSIDVEVTLEPIERLLDYAQHYAFQMEIPNVAESIDCWIQQTATVAQISCWMQMNGAKPETWFPVIDARREKLRNEELVEWARRHDLDEAQQRQLLQSQGWVRENEARAFVELYDHLPTINDHLHWLQRNVFDSAYVKDFNLLDGFSTDAEIRALPGMEGYTQKFPLQGRNFWQAFGHDLRSLGMLQKYAALHYAAHWINLSVGQLAEMFQRLRPGRVDAAIQFTIDDFNRMLAEQDVAPFFRKRLEYIAYRTLPLRQLNAATQQGRFDRVELVERWQDVGFRPADAGIMADTSLVQAKRQVVSLGHGYTPALVSQLASYGLITKAKANDYLNPQGFTEAQVSELFDASADKRELTRRKRRDENVRDNYARLIYRGYRDGSIDRAAASAALESAGYSTFAAALALNSAEIIVKQDSVREAIKAIHSGFRLGATDQAGAVNALVLSGVTPEMARIYAARWQLEMSLPRLALSTGRILTMARKGIMSVANAALRLKNLGWADGDIQLQLVEIEQELNQAKARQAERTQKALNKARQANERATVLIRKGYCRLYTPSKMVRWYALRIIDESTFRQRLGYCGYDTDSIQRLFEEATVARQAKDQTAEKKGTTGVEYTGQGADTSGSTPKSNP